MDQKVVPRHGLWRRAGCMAALGLVGVFSLLLQPLPEALMRQHPELAEMPPWLLQLAVVLNPLILLLAAALSGALLAQRVGLRSVLAGTASAGDMRRAWPLAAGAGLATGALAVLLDIAAAPVLGDAWSRLLWQASRPDLPALLVGVLYGGITEEILLRWGVMSALAWALWSIGGKKRMGFWMWAAIVATALIFGAAHLPALAAQVELTTGIVVRTVLINALAAVVYGWVCWRHHLEAAMLSHASSHLAMATAWALLG